jgi:hypothetical protein
MSTKPVALEYLLLFRNNAWYQDLAPDVIEESMNQFTAWADKLSQEGKLKGGWSDRRSKSLHYGSL